MPEIEHFPFQFVKVSGGEFISRKDGYYATNVGSDICGTLLATYNQNFACDHCEGVIEVWKISNTELFKTSKD